MSSEMKTVLRLSPSEYMALIDVVATYLRLDEPQLFHDVARDVDTHSTDLLALLTSAADFELVPDAKPAPADSTLDTLRAQHTALDLLMAMVITRDSMLLRGDRIERDNVFLPSRSGLIWDAMVRGNAAILALGGGR